MAKQLITLDFFTKSELEDLASQYKLKTFGKSKETLKEIIDYHFLTNFPQAPRDSNQDLLFEVPREFNGKQFCTLSDFSKGHLIDILRQNYFEKPSISLRCISKKDLKNYVDENLRQLFPHHAKDDENNLTFRISKLLSGNEKTENNFIQIEHKKALLIQWSRFFLLFEPLFYNTYQCLSANFMSDDQINHIFLCFRVFLLRIQGDHPSFFSFFRKFDGISLEASRKILLEARKNTVFSVGVGPKYFEQKIEIFNEPRESGCTQCSKCGSIFVTFCNKDSPAFFEHEQNCAGPKCGSCSVQFDSFDTYNSHVENCNRTRLPFERIELTESEEKELTFKQHTNQRKKINHRGHGRARKKCWGCGESVSYALFYREHIGKLQCKRKTCKSCGKDFPWKFFESHIKKCLISRNNFEDNAEISLQEIVDPNVSDFEQNNSVSANETGSLFLPTNSAIAEAEESGVFSQENNAHDKSIVQKFFHDLDSNWQQWGIGVKTEILKNMASRLNNELDSDTFFETTSGFGLLSTKYFESFCQSNVKKRVKKDAISAAISDSPSKKTIENFAKIAHSAPKFIKEAVENRKFLMEGQNLRPHASTGQIKTADFEKVSKINSFLEYRSIPIAGSQIYKTKNKNSVTDKNLTLLYQKVCTIHHDNRNVCKYQNIKRILCDDSKNLYEDFLLEFPQYSDMTYYNFQKLTPFYFEAMKPKFVEMCCCLSCQNIKCTEKYLKRLGQFLDCETLTNINIDEIMSKSFCVQNPPHPIHGKFAPDCLRSKIKHCHQHFVREQSCQNCTHKCDAGGIENFLNSLKNQSFEQNKNTYIRFSHWIVNAKNRPAYVDLKDKMSEMTIESGFKLAQKFLEENILHYWENQQSKLPIKKILETEVIPENVLLLQLDYGSDIMIHGSRMTQSEWLKCPTLKILTASAKIKIAGKQICKIFHGLSWSKKARAAFDLEDLIIKDFQTNFGPNCIAQILRLTDNCAGEFKSSRILTELPSRPIKTVLMYKTPKHGKSEVDGFHTAVAKYIRSQNLFTRNTDLDTIIELLENNELNMRNQRKRGERERVYFTLENNLPDLPKQTQSEALKVNIASCRSIACDRETQKVISRRGICVCQNCLSGHFETCENLKNFENILCTGQRRKSPDTISCNDILINQNLNDFLEQDENSYFRNYIGKEDREKIFCSKWFPRMNKDVRYCSEVLNALINFYNTQHFPNFKVMNIEETFSIQKSDPSKNFSNFANDIDKLAVPLILKSFSNSTWTPIRDIDFSSAPTDEFHLALICFDIEMKSFFLLDPCLHLYNLAQKNEIVEYVHQLKEQFFSNTEMNFLEKSCLKQTSEDDCGPIFIENLEGFLKTTLRSDFEILKVRYKQIFYLYQNHEDHSDQESPPELNETPPAPLQNILRPLPTFFSTPNKQVPNNPFARVEITPIKNSSSSDENSPTKARKFSKKKRRKLNFPQPISAASSSSD